MDSYAIPAFFCPIRIETHPDAGRHTEAARDWLARCGLLDDERYQAHLIGSEIERLVELTVPHGRWLWPVVVLNYWYHIVDDFLGDTHAAGLDAAETARVAMSLHHVLECPEAEVIPAARPFADTLVQIAREVHAHASAEQYAGWKAGVQSYLMFEGLEAAARERDETPDLDTYILHDLLGRAAWPSMLMVAIAGGYVVPPAEMNSPMLRALTEAACLLACVANDIYSWGKERFQPDHGYTLVRVLAREAGCSTEEAVKEAVRFHDRVMSRFVRMLEAVAGDRRLSDEARLYTRDLGCWVSGQIEWGLTSARFTAPEYAVTVPQGRAAYPSADETDGPPAAAISWWWELEPRVATKSRSTSTVVGAC